MWNRDCAQSGGSQRSYLPCHGQGSGLQLVLSCLLESLVGLSILLAYFFSFSLEEMHFALERAWIFFVTW